MFRFRCSDRIAEGIAEGIGMLILEAIGFVICVVVIGAIAAAV